jgi:putative transcriptional regulator
MIRFRLQELLAEKQFREGRRTTLTELSEATSINRVTLSKMVNQRGYSTVTDNLDRLCKFFNCTVGDIAEFIPEDEQQKDSPNS